MTNDKIFQCAQSVCLSFNNLTTSNIRRCQMNCLSRNECLAATFYQSNLQYQLFNNSINQNANMSYEMNVVTMISIFGTRYPPDLTPISTSSSTSTASTSISTISVSTTDIPRAWVITANMNTARSMHTASLLSNGKVLVSGGSNGYGVFNSSELH